MAKELPVYKPEDFAIEWVTSPYAPETVLEPLNIDTVYIPSPFPPMADAFGGLTVDTTTLFQKDVSVATPTFGYDVAAGLKLGDYSTGPYIAILNESRDPLRDFLNWEIFALPDEVKLSSVLALKAPSVEQNTEDGFAYAYYLYAEGARNLRPLIPENVLAQGQDVTQEEVDEFLDNLL